MNIGGGIQFKVPQNIDMQDRIVGPLTMIQFLYAIFGAAFAYILLNILPKPFSYFLAVMVAILTVCIIFVKVNERPFLKFVGDLMIYVVKPKIRIWSKVGTPFKVDVYENPNANRKMIRAQKNISKSQLRDLADIIDSHQ